MSRKRGGVTCVQLNESKKPDEYFSNAKQYFGIVKGKQKNDPERKLVELSNKKVPGKPPFTKWFRNGTYTEIDSRACYPSYKEQFCAALNTKYPE